MTGNSQKKWRKAKKLLARFVYRENARCPFEDEVDWCPGEIRVEDLNNYPEVGRKGKTYPNVVWHHLNDEKEKAQKWYVVPEVEDRDDVVLAHAYCHKVHYGRDNFYN